jgi:hypothetical protein
MATLGAGGLRFLNSANVRMLSEDLYVSPSAVRVRYEFLNEGDADEPTLVAFPMPDITGSPDFMVSVPTFDPENIFGFETTVNGEPVEAELHQYAFANNIEYTDFLLDLGLPLAPHTRETVDAVNALSDEQKAELMHNGLVIPMEYSTDPDGKIWVTDYYPAWTLRSTYSWETVFPAGKEVVVEHSYTPGVGGTVATTFMAEPSEGYDPMAVAQQKYCVDDAFVRAVRKQMRDPNDTYSAPFFEQWIQYIWSTGSNWSGAIGEFHLTIDKGDPKNLVSFCWDGEVTKTGPTTFEMSATDWFPPWGKELEIMLLDYQENQ